MNPEIPEAEHFCAVARNMANVMQGTSSDSTEKMPVHLYNSRIGNWDELWLFSGEAETAATQPLIKVALTGLSDEQRMRLDELLPKDRDPIISGTYF